jgi:outer membrane protein OmpA-like peptidoglycan-associated protein
MVLDAESVSFVGDKAVFTDQSQAEAAIREVAQTLLEHPENQVYIAGCTASAQGREAFCQQLSLDRAEAVESLLLACGVPESQMITVGLGDQAPWQKEDLDAAGRQIEEKASQNRCVVILDRTDPTYGDAVSKFVN